MREVQPIAAGKINRLGTLLNDLVQLLKLPEQLAPYLPDILKFLQDELRLVIQVTGSQTQTADLLSQIWENRAALIQLLKDEVRDTFENYEQLLRQSDPDEREYLVASYGSQLLSEFLVAVFTAGGGMVLKNGAKILRQITKYLAKKDLKSVLVLLKRLGKKAAKKKNGDRLEPPKKAELPKIKTPISGIEADRKIIFDKLDVFQRDELIDPNRLGTNKNKARNRYKALRDSYNRMKRGQAPIGPDGESIELHHVN